MIIPSTSYASQTDVDAVHYPHGKARNISTAGANDGTPLEKDWLNDVWGFFQALTAAAGITPSGSPETADSSQLLSAINYLVSHAPNRISQASRAVAASALSGTFSGSTPTLLTNSTMDTVDYVAVGDKFKFWYAGVHVDNTASAADATVIVRVTQDVGGTDVTSDIAKYLVPQTETRELFITGEFVVATAGPFVVELYGKNDSINNTIYSSQETVTHLIGHWEVIRP